MPAEVSAPRERALVRIPNSAGLLKLIRDHPGMTFEKLKQRVGLDGYFAEAYLASPLEGLIELGLVRRDSRRRLVVGELYGNLRRVFPQLSLTAMAEERPGMRVLPFHGLPCPPAEPLDVFVVMPFAKPFESLWTQHVRRLVRRLGMTCARADDFFAGGHVMDDVWNGVCAARLVLADISGANPNVFYELGLAHAIGKPVLLITRDPPEAVVPFDVASLRYIRYTDTAEGIDKLMADLKVAIGACLADERE